MSADIIVYGGDWCGDCVRTKAAFKRLNVDYKYIDIVAHPEERQTVKQLSGVLSVPLVIFPDQTQLTEPTDEALEAKLKELGRL